MRRGMRRGKGEERRRRKKGCLESVLIKGKFQIWNGRKTSVICYLKIDQNSNGNANTILGRVEEERLRACGACSAQGAVWFGMSVIHHVI